MSGPVEYPKMCYIDGVVRPGVKFWHIAGDRAQEAALRRLGFFPEGQDGRSLFNGADPAKFDHNDDGKPGGSKKGPRSRRG